MSIWPIDPKTKEPSVSLAILIAATAFMAGAITMQLMGKAHDVSLITEWWFGSASLYFGRRLKWSKGEVGVADPAKSGE